MSEKGRYVTLRDTGVPESAKSDSHITFFGASARFKELKPKTSCEWNGDWWKGFCHALKVLNSEVWNLKPTIEPYLKKEPY